MAEYTEERRNRFTGKVAVLTDEEARRFIIADNVGFGEHDWEILANEWDADELADWGLEGFLLTMRQN